MRATTYNPADIGEYVTLARGMHAESAWANQIPFDIATMISSFDRYGSGVDGAMWGLHNEAGELVGFLCCQLGRFDFARDIVVFERGIYVRPDARGRGTRRGGGTVAVIHDTLAAYAAKHKAKHVVLDLSSGISDTAVRVFTRIGYSKAGDIMIRTV